MSKVSQRSFDTGHRSGGAHHHHGGHHRHVGAALPAVVVFCPKPRE
jgi:hypothetical protein